MSNLIELLESMVEDSSLLEEVPIELLEELNVLIWANLRDRDNTSDIDEWDDTTDIHRWEF